MKLANVSEMYYSLDYDSEMMEIINTVGHDWAVITFSTMDSAN